MSTPSCCECGRTFSVHESAWAEDWTVVDEDGATFETRYTCFDCEPDE